MRSAILLQLLLWASSPLLAQPVVGLRGGKGLSVATINGQRSPTTRPLFSWVAAGNLQSAADFAASQQGNNWLLKTPQLNILVEPQVDDRGGWKARIQFRNTSADTLTLENVVPLGATPDHPHITGLGDHRLSRSHLFLPGRKPLNVLLPDNAWELGFSTVPWHKEQQLVALTRRRSWENAQRRRFVTELNPGGSVEYFLWLDTFVGDWQEGLKLFFQERYLYDLAEPFNDSLYQRPDQQWIRHSYAMHLLMAWDHRFYDAQAGGYQLESFLERGRRLYGGDDVIGVWPNWPMLGLDQRNQWDLLRDLPGGTERLRQWGENLRARGTRWFISYNPWDESTRWEDHHAGLSEMIQAVGADGVVLDTEGKSSPERQQAADRVRPGVVMYSEGMAVPRDMPGIVAGRVHNALYYPPVLNLNKFIRPDFAIFRVAEQYLEPIRREYALSLFNGYGTELNVFRPGQPDWLEEDYRFWGRTLRILRENTSNFTSDGFLPLLPTLRDEIYVNAWELPEKTIYTVFSVIPEGHNGPLFEVPIRPGYHWVDLWRNEEVKPEKSAPGVWQIPVRLDAYSLADQGTNNEGAVSAIALLPQLLQVRREGDMLVVDAPQGDEVRIWPGNPSYEKEENVLRIPVGQQRISLREHFGRYEGKFVVQLFRHGELLDQQQAFLPPGTARLISQVAPTPRRTLPPPGMVAIPAGSFQMRVTYGDNFIPNPVDYPEGELNMHGFFMDKYPVTNQQYAEFIAATHYRPLDTLRYLRHWANGQVPIGQENHPVTHVSYEDAKAYATWAGKRLPTEIEWQYAAQTVDLRDWPWGPAVPVKREEQVITETLTVSRLQVDSAFCNTGNGRLDPVGSYPQGANPFGLEDLVGCVWQLTNDLYDNGTNYFLVMKGGSYFLPASSWWYVEGGPRELTYTQKLLRIAPGWERNATVGFRCVMDRE